MEEFKIVVEVENELEQNDRFGIEDAISAALKQMGYEVNSVRLYW